jgi:hypothetical protein
MNEEYQKIANYVLRVFSVAGTMSFSCHVEATPDRLLVFPISYCGEKLPLALNIVHISKMKRHFEEMAVTQDQTGYYRLEMPYKEIVEYYEIQKISQDS